MSLEDNPALFGKKHDGTPKAMEVGRLGAKSKKRLTELAPDREVLAGLYIDARPMRENVEVRVRLSAFEDEPEEVEDESV